MAITKVERGQIEKASVSGETPALRHSLTIDSGWREVCDPALESVRRFG